MYFGGDGAENTSPFCSLDRQLDNLAVGDVVLVATETSHRNSWPLGRIVETYPNKKGFLRRARVRTKSAVYESPVDKLCLLVEGGSSSRENTDTKI